TCALPIYGQIAEHSTAEKDLLKDGFWAANYAEELKPERLSVRFFVRMDDVSNRILGQVSDKMSEAEREAAINREIAKIEQENNEIGRASCRERVKITDDAVDSKKRTNYS